MSDIKKIILKYSLLNAQQYGKAELGSVLGKVIAEAPESKKNIESLKKQILSAIADVNKMKKEAIEKEVKKFGKIEKPKEDKHELPDLPNVKKGKVVMRMAPNPNGPPHIGHARMIILNDEYVKRYKGKLILRFDDTDPKNPNKIPMKEAYKWFEEDLKWMGVKYSKVSRASERLAVYYKYFEQFLKDGLAYICTCQQEEWSKLVRIERGTCPCRGSDPKENLLRWKKIFIGEFKEGQAVGRIKTPQDIADPAVLDWVAFRIVNNPEHPFVKDKHVWPMLDFASAIDDHEFGVTHIIRGKDLAVSEVRQKILYEKLGWEYPETRIYGKFVTTENMVISKSKISEGIRNKVYSGWDDPRLATLRAFKKRGIQPQAIRNYINDLGLNEHETTVDLDILYNKNREVIDKKSNRYFFVTEPIEIFLSKLPMRTVKAPTYPGKRTYRKIPVSKKVFVDKIDFIANRGKEIRLMHFANFVLDKNAKFTGKPLKEIPKLHWCPEKNVKIKIITQNGKTVEGIGEPELSKVKVDQTVQFERISFARCDSVKPLIFYLAHR